MGKYKMKKSRSKTQELDWASIEKMALKRFGIKKFLPGQHDLIEAVLEGKDAMGVLPTGGGKSLCFQLPSLFLDGSTVVVSPLIALMQDQEGKADDLGIDVSRMDSTLTTREERDALEVIEEGNSRLIYVTPERLENVEFLDMLKTTKISLFVVDEAHCVSQWGHDFRPAYLNLRHAITQLGNPTILALTATATEEISQDIVKQLGLKNPLIVRTGIARPNLEFQVVQTVNEQMKQQQLLDLINEQSGSGIVYTATIKAAEAISQWLKEQGINSSVYHGKVKSSEREQIQNDFMDNTIKVIVATKAFGLGIDKPDVRFVVHYQFPDSLESYYQEAGRAGRDGQPAQAVLLYQLEDKRIQSYFLGGKYPSRDESWQILQAFSRADGGQCSLTSLAELTEVPSKKVKVIVAHLEAAGIIARKKKLVKVKDFESPESLDSFLSEYETRHASDRDRLNEMMHYGQTLQCRVQFLKRYFQEDDLENCGKCDNCKSPPMQASA